MLKSPKLIKTGPLGMKKSLFSTRRCVHTTQCALGTIQEVRQQLTSKSISAKELVEQYLKAAHSVESNVNSFITIDDAGAIKQVGQFLVLKARSHHKRYPPTTALVTASLSLL